MEPLHDGPGVVPRPVVNDPHSERQPGLLAGRPQPIGELGEGLALLVGRNDNRHVRRLGLGNRMLKSGLLHGSVPALWLKAKSHPHVFKVRVAGQHIAQIELLHHDH